ncbi:hypothetical protein ACOMHN_036566 [Nucella lapillus]
MKPPGRFLSVRNPRLCVSDQGFSVSPSAPFPLASNCHRSNPSDQGFSVSPSAPFPLASNCHRSNPSDQGFSVSPLSPLPAGLKLPPV